MGLKGAIKSTGEGKGLLGLAVAVAIGMGILAPLFAGLFSWIKNKVSPAPTSTTGS